MQYRIYSHLILMMLSFSTLAQESVVAPTLIIEDKEDKESGYTTQTSSLLNPYQTFKSENVAREKLNDNSRQNLSELLDDQIGVDSQTYCANCGAKRLSINGLKGEHTSILIDGLPLHSAVSSFYGVDNIPITALKDVYVMRGTGASLTNPEAIGGTLDLITIDPLNFNHKIGLSYGFDDHLEGKSKNFQFLTGFTHESKKWGLYLSGQASRLDTWDVDDNKVSESPQRESKNIMAKGRFLIGKSDFSLRGAINELEILGGYVHPEKPETVSALAPGETDFVNGSVHEDFIGDPAKITDWVEVKRQEAALTSTHYINSNTTFEFKSGFARQEQSAIYQHGFDYANTDNLFVMDGNIQYATNSGSIFKVGLFLKDQRLRSASLKLFEQRDVKKDNFDYLSTAGYLSYTLFLENIELDFALRADKINLNWLELENKIEKTILAPRFMALHNITEHLTQRFSYGLGYRAPLTFFESQHGNSESGYQVNITELEKSHSFVYSLSYNTPNGYLTFGSHYTLLQNMAYGFEQYNVPILYQNETKDFKILVNDLLLGWKPSDKWLLETSFEVFTYQDSYKRRLPTAAIEERIQLKTSYDHNHWAFRSILSVIPSRDLTAYGNYRFHYINRDQSEEPNLSDNMRKKGMKSPTFLTLDLSVQYKLNQKQRFTFSIDNLFDYTQASRNDTPTTWHWHFQHAHFDGLHTWGPNRGRTFNLSYNADF